MPKYLVINTRTLESSLVNLDEAARITELDPDEIEWAIEQMGRCDVEQWLILPDGATYAPYDPDNPDHNPNGRSQGVTTDSRSLAEAAHRDAALACEKAIEAIRANRQMPNSESDCAEVVAFDAAWNGGLLRSISHPPERYCEINSQKRVSCRPI